MPDIVDDVTIPDDAELWRRIHPDWIIWDDAVGRRRVSSQAFQDHPRSGMMSFCLSSEVEGPHVPLAGHPGYFLVGITAGERRALGFILSRDPPMPGEIGHVWVSGPSKKKRRRPILDACRWIVAPEDVRE